MRSVVVQPIHGQTKGVHDVRRHAGEDGMTLGEEGVERTAEPIIVELVGGNAPQEFGAALLGPTGDIDQRHRLRQARAQEHAQHLTMGELELGIGRKMAIDDARHVHLFQPWRDDGQRSEVT